MFHFFSRSFALLILFSSLFIFPFQTKAQNIPLNQEELVMLLNEELSGESAKRNLEFISRQHRMRGSEGYTKSVNFIADKLKEYNLEGIEIIKIPTDGKTMYGTQKARLAWDVEFAELWEQNQVNGKWFNAEKIADWESIPLVLAQDSHSGNVEAELIDIGKGNSESDYEGIDVKGKLVLTSLQPESVVPLAIEKYGAVGILSYAQNQVTAWYKENDNLIRWGHLDSFSETKTFGFMLSLKQARAFQSRLESGDIIRLHAKVSAGRHAGFYDILSAIIEGSDDKLKNEEIAFTCHLDHPRPGANDNASGCVAILEVARTLKKLIDEGKIERPKRTIRFIWSPEIEGTTALLNFKPELAKRIKTNIHMDMVGGGPETKAIFHVSKSPQSIPNFVNDIAESFGAFVNKQSDDYASGVNTDLPIVSEEGGKEALHAVLGNFHMGSDFQVFAEGSFSIPAIYLHDWPDRYIHTNYDTPAMIDPTKLKRSSFIGAASAYVIANCDTNDVDGLIELRKQRILNRTSALLSYCELLPIEEKENAKYYFWKYEMDAFNSIKRYALVSKAQEKNYSDFISSLKSSIGSGKAITIINDKANKVYSRNMNVKGPLSVFGYDYFFDHYDASKPTPKIYSYSGLKGSGGEYSYETLNLVNGKRTALEIRNQLSAEFGPIPFEVVLEYLEALNSIDIIN
ncbi:MAG: aminopeptidase YwaD [Glaciecola sp.]|jgi:aminopeptidase YwaD